MKRFVSVAMLLWCMSVNDLVAEQTATENPDKETATTALYKQFEEALSGTKLIGQFTVTGRDGEKLPREEYTIKSVRKLPDGDYWLFTARIKYGKNDVTLPLPLEVKWADQTPVITLSDMTIPGLGTFSARVVIDRDKYAGTWTHGQAGGHLFGMIEKIKEEPSEE